MKKILYSVLIALTIIVSATSCTEETVTPANKTTTGGNTMDNVG